MSNILVVIGIFLLLLLYVTFELVRGLEKDMEGY